MFGIPEGGTGQIFINPVGKEPAINTYQARHEQTAAIIADAYARASGLPAVVDVLIDRGPSPDDWRADARRSGKT